jgi:hypothetical protein
MPPNKPGALDEFGVPIIAAVVAVDGEQVPLPPVE